MFYGQKIDHGEQINSGNATFYGKHIRVTRKTFRKSLNDITEQVGEEYQIVNENTSASNEQVEGLNLVKTTISQVSTVVSTNTASSDEITAASKELSGQALLLVEIVDEYIFKKVHRAER